MKKSSSSRKFKTAHEMDRALESASLAHEFADRGAVKTPPLKKINLDLPAGIVGQIDRIAERIGVSRQPLLKMWIHERLKAEASNP